MANEENFRVFEGVNDLVQKLTGEERKQKDLERRVVEGIEARYTEFLAGKQPKKILYKGDFEYAVNSWELFLSGGEGEISIPYERFANALYLIVGNDIIYNIKIKRDTIRKVTNEETGNLNLYRQRNPNAVFTVELAYFKLKSPPGEERVLQFETYFPDQRTLLPLSLIVLAKRMRVDKTGIDDFMNRYRVRPRSHAAVVNEK